jgi:esterase/lipase
MKIIYCISGLGADERAFARLKIEGYSLKVIPWLNPQPKETLEQYAGRMLQFIETDNPLMMGLSFGGIMCIEIAKQIQVKKIFLISSIKTRQELPDWMKLVAKTNINKIYSMKSYKITEPLQNYFLGATMEDEKEMARAYRKNANLFYTNWAVNEVLNWKNEWLHPNLFHIHGSRDKIFPLKKIKADAILEDAGHFMIMNRAKEVSMLINANL